MMKTTYHSEPLAYCLNTVKAMLRNWTKGARCTRYKVYLDGEGNFRNDVATIKPYKGNRKQPKPLHYQAIRQYLIDHQRAIVVPVLENDDMLSIIQYKEYLEVGDDWDKCKKVIVTIDKDGLNTPGWMFNPDKDEKPRFVSELEAARNFFCQLVTGDPVDNIQGVPGRSKKCKACASISKMDIPREMYEAALAEYTGAGLGLPELQENAKLLWMLRVKPKSKEELMLPWQFEDHFSEE